MPRTIPGKELTSRRVGTLICRPPNPQGQLTDHGFTPAEYAKFIVDNKQHMMLLRYGDGNHMMVLKTTNTPNIGPETTVKAINQSAEQVRSMLPAEAVVSFNKDVCATNGLILFMGKGDQLTRQKVV